MFGASDCSGGEVPEDTNGGFGGLYVISFNIHGQKYN